jgi:competence protein ComEC
MSKRKFIYPLILVLLLLAAVMYVIVSFSGRSHPLRVVFLDVEQGDSILILQGSSQILIDGGKDGTLLLEKLGKYIPFWDRTIETVIETHPDQDHIGGLASALKTYEVSSVIETDQQSTSQTYALLEQLIEQKNIQKIIAIRGQKISFPEGGELEILFPLSSNAEIQEKDSNSASIVSRLAYGKDSFLFTGDLPSEKEQELISSFSELKTDVLKVAHHGSKYATGDEFLDAVAPKDAVISVGKNNMYGHPNQETLDRLIAHGVKIFRTDKIGDIEYECVDEKCERL